MQLADDCMNLFDDAAITVAGYTVHKFERVRDAYIPPMTPEAEQESDEELWQQYIVEYLLTLKKN